MSKKRLDAFIAELDDAKRVWEPRLERWQMLEEIYHGTAKLPENMEKLLRSQLRIPWAWQMVETVIPRIMDPEPRFEFKPVENGDRQLSDVLNALVREQLKSDQFVSKQRSFIRDSCVLGIGIAQVRWHQKSKKVKVRDSKEKTGFREEEKIVENRPTIDYIDPTDFFADPRGRNDREWRYVFLRSWKSFAELKKAEKDGYYKGVDNLKQDESDEKPRGAIETAEEAKARRGNKFAVYTRYDIRDNTIMTVCGKQVLRDEPSPYYHGDLPFFCFSTQPDPRSIVGVSEVEKIAQLQEAVWTKDNQRIDAVNYALNFVMIVDPNIPNARHLTLQPGAKIYAMNGQRVEQLQTNANQAMGLQESDQYIGAMQQMTGATAMLQGSESAMNINNATTASILQEEGNKRMAMKKLEYRLFLSRIAKQVVQLNHQYLSAFELQRIVGDDAIGLKAPAPEEIPMFLDVLPEAMNESVSRITERNSVNELLNISGAMHGVPMTDGTVYDIKPLLEDALKLHDKEPSRSFPEPNPELMQGQGGGIAGGAQPQQEQPIDNGTSDMSQVPVNDMSQVPVE